MQNIDKQGSLRKGGLILCVFSYHHNSRLFRKMLAAEGVPGFKEECATPTAMMMYASKGRLNQQNARGSNSVRL